MGTQLSADPANASRRVWEPLGQGGGEGQGRPLQLQPPTPPPAAATHPHSWCPKEQSCYCARRAAEPHPARDAGAHGWQGRVSLPPTPSGKLGGKSVRRKAPPRVRLSLFRRAWSAGGNVWAGSFWAGEKTGGAAPLLGLNLLLNLRMVPAAPGRGGSEARPLHHMGERAGEMALRRESKGQGRDQGYL